MCPDHPLPHRKTQRRSASTSSAGPSSEQAPVVVAGRTYLNHKELAQLLGVAPRTLARWDERRIGPPKIKLGRLVLYDLTKLHAWLESHERSAPTGRAGRAR